MIAASVAAIAQCGSASAPPVRSSIRVADGDSISERIATVRLS